MANVIGTTASEFLAGTASDDFIVGLDGSDTIDAQGGNDLVVADGPGSGNDSILGGDGNDALFAGAGNDSVFGGAGNDIALGEDGNDRMFGDAGNDALYGGEGNDSLDGGDGGDIIFGEGGGDSIVGGGDNDLIIADFSGDAIGGGSDVIFLGAGNDTVFAGGAQDVVQGEGGNDLIVGDGGDDILTGDAGDDGLFGGIGADALDGGDGNDVLIGEGGADTLFGGVGNDIMDGGQGADSINGGSGTDRYVISVDDVFADGGADNDTIVIPAGFAGAIVLNLGNAANQNGAGTGPVLQSFESVDGGLATVGINATGSADANSLIGGNSADTLIGGGGDDTIAGGGGGDSIRGNNGNDAISTGAGADTVGVAVNETGTDTVSDFTRGTDKIQIIGADGVPLTGDALAQAANAAILSQTVVGGNTQFTIGTKTVVVNGTTPLTADDFAAPPVNVVPSDTGTPGNDGFGGGSPLALPLDTFGGTRTLIGEPGGSIIDGQAGTDVVRITGDADARIDLTNPLRQLERVDLNGDGTISGPTENNVNPIISLRNIEIIDAYPRDTLVDPDNPNDVQRTRNYFGDLRVDGTGFDGDGVNTDGNIILSGFGDDTILSGIGCDFVAGAGGTDLISTGRNADFIFAELSLLDAAITGGPPSTIEGGETFDNDPAQNTDTLLLEASDDDEPVFVYTAARFAGGPPSTPGTTSTNVFSDITVFLSLDNTENVDASGNTYGFMRDVGVQLGGGRDSIVGTNTEGHGIGSTAQLRIFDAGLFIPAGSGGGEPLPREGATDNRYIGGFDNDKIAGFSGQDFIAGGNGVGDAGLAKNFGAAVNPNIQNLTNDGQDSILAGADNDTVTYESWDDIVGADGSFTTQRGFGSFKAQNLGNEAIPDQSVDPVDRGQADWLVVDARTTHNSLIVDGNENGKRPSVYGDNVDENQAYDRGLTGNTVRGNGVDIYNIDGPTDGADAGSTVDTLEYLFIDLDATKYARLVTGNSSQDQTGGVNMDGFENVDGSGYSDNLGAFLANINPDLDNFATATLPASALQANLVVDTDGDAATDCADDLVFNATAVRLDLRGTDADVCVIDISESGGAPFTFVFTEDVTLEVTGGNGNDTVTLSFENGDTVSGFDPILDRIADTGINLEGIGDFFGGEGGEGFVVFNDVDQDTVDGDGNLLDDGSNTLIGGAGTDRIEGRGGDDVLIGGTGANVADLFVFDIQGNESSEGSILIDAPQALFGGEGHPPVSVRQPANSDASHNPMLGFGGEFGRDYAPGGDGIDLIGDFTGGKGGTRLQGSVDQVAFVEFNNGTQGYEEDRAAALYDLVQLDGSGGNTENAQQANDVAVFLGANSVIATRQLYTIDLDDLQRNDFVQLVISTGFGPSLTFSYTLKTGENQCDAVDNLVCQINALAGQDTALIGLTAYVDDYDAAGYGECDFEDDCEQGPDDIDPNDVGGNAARLNFANLDPNVVYTFQLTVNGETLSSGDQNTEGRVNNDTGSFIMFANYNGNDNGFDGDNILFLLRDESISSDVRQQGYQTSILATALEAGSNGANALTGRNALSNGDYGDDQLIGGNGNDVLAGGTDTNVSTGSNNGQNTGDDVFHGSLGSDTIIGGGNLSGVFFEDRVIYQGTGADENRPFGVTPAATTPTGQGSIQVNITNLSADFRSPGDFGSPDSSALRGADGNTQKLVNFSNNPNQVFILNPAGENANNYGNINSSSGTDQFSGLEVISKFGGITDRIDVSGLSDDISNSVSDLGVVRINLTSGDIDTFNDTDDPNLMGTQGTFIGRFNIAGFEWVNGGAANEEVIMQVLAVDLNQDGDTSDLGENLAPDAFESNLINLGSRSDDGGGGGNLAGRPGDNELPDADGGDPDEEDTVVYSFYGLNSDYNCDGDSDNRPDLEIFVSAIGEGVLDDDVLDPRNNNVNPTVGSNANNNGSGIDVTDVVRMTDGFLNNAIKGGPGAAPSASSQGLAVGDNGGLRYVDDRLIQVEVIDIRELDINNSGPTTTDQINDDDTQGTVDGFRDPGDLENPLFDILNVVAQSNRALQSPQLGIFDGIVFNMSENDVTISGTLALTVVDAATGATLTADNILEGAGEFNAIARGNQPSRQIMVVRGSDELEVFLSGSGNDRVIVADDNTGRVNTSTLYADATADESGELNTLQVRGGSAGNGTGSMVETQSTVGVSQSFISSVSHGEPEVFFRYFMDGGNNDIIDLREVDRADNGSSADIVVVVDFTSSNNIVFQSSEGGDGDGALNNLGQAVDGLVREGARDKVLFDNNGDRVFSDGERVDFAYDNEIYIAAMVDGSAYGNVDGFGNDTLSACSGPSPDGSGQGDGTGSIIVFDHSNVIDLREFGANAVSSDFLTNATADDVYLIFNDGTRLDPNNGDEELPAHDVRLAGTSSAPLQGLLVSTFVDDGVVDDDTGATVSNPSFYWNEVQGSDADDFVIMTDNESRNYHALFLGKGGNEVNYNAVEIGPSVDYVFRSGDPSDNDSNPGNSTSSTRSDILVSIGLAPAYTDEVNVIEQDNSTGNGILRELIVRGSTDSAVVDVLNLNFDVDAQGTSNPFGSSNRTNFVSLDGIYQYSFDPAGTQLRPAGVVVEQVFASNLPDNGDDVTTPSFKYQVTTGSNISAGSNPVLYDANDNNTVNLSLENILAQSTTSGDVQFGNSKLGVDQIEVIDQSGQDSSLIAIGHLASAETIFGGEGNDRLYYTGESGDLLDAWCGYRNGDVFAGGFGSSTETTTNTATAPSSDFDTLAVADNADINIGVSEPQASALVFNLANTTNQGEANTRGEYYDFENFDAREVGAPGGGGDIFFVVTAFEPGVSGPSQSHADDPDATTPMGSIIFGGNAVETDSNTVNGDGGDTLNGGLGDDTIGGAFGGDLINLDADGDTTNSDGEDVVVYQFSDESDNGNGQTDDNIDVVTGFFAGTDTSTATTFGTNEDRFDFRDVDANSQVANDQDFFFFNVFTETTGGTDDGDFGEVLSIASSQSGVATLVFDPDGSAGTGVTGGTLYAFIDGDNDPDMVIRITGTSLENLSDNNFLGGVGGH